MEKQEDLKKHEGEQLGRFIEDLGYSRLYVSKCLEVSPTTISNHIAKPELGKILKCAYQLCIGIHPDSFVEDRLIFSSQLDNSETKVLSSALVKHKNYYEYLEQYFEAIDSEVKKAKKSIKVVDYMKNNFQAGNNFKKSRYHEEYHSAYRDYLVSIENAIFKARKELGDFEYKRYLQTPVRDVHTEVLGDNKLLQGLDLIYLDSIEHYCRLWKNGIDFKVYLLTDAIRPSSYMIIDGKTLISEGIRYKSSFSRPDLLLIRKKINDGDTESVAARLLKTYEDETDADQLDSKKIALTPDELYKNYGKIRACYKRVAKHMNKSLESQYDYQFYLGRIERTEMKMEALSILF